jgi:hypothetical protein
VKSPRPLVAHTVTVAQATLVILVTLVMTTAASGCDGDLEVELPTRTVRAVEGPIQLVGSGNGTCSHGMRNGGSPSGPRWCAFARSATGGGTQLWAVNVSRALASQRSVPCDGTSPHCVSLTASLWDESPLFEIGHPYIHGFTGDTLVFYADARNKDPEEGYLGPVRAWRPGMAAPRQISGPSGFSCTGHLRSDGVICLENEGGFGPALEFDLLAGTLGAAGTSDPLPRLRRVKPYGTRRAPAWQVAFSPSGEHLLVSTEAPDGPVERLEIIPSAQVGKTEPQELLRNLSRWEVSPDGSKIFYLAGYSGRPEGDGLGTLTVADFPSMKNPVPLAAGVAAYEPHGPPGNPGGGPVRTVSLLQEVSEDGGTFRMIPDIGRPQDVVTIAQGIAEPRVSPDLRYTVVESVQDGVTYVAHNGGAGQCALTDPGSNAFGVVFGGATRQVFWMQTGAGPEAKIEGWMADPEGCGGRRTFAEKMAFMRPSRAGLLFGLEEDSPTTMSVYYDSLAAPAASAPQLLARSVDPQFALLDDRYLVFTISGENRDAGLWIHGPVR